MLVYESAKIANVGGIFTLEAKTINDCWFKTLYYVLEQDEEGNFLHAYPTGLIQKGSYEGGQSRLQFRSYAAVIEYPDQDFIVTMPPGLEGISPIEDPQKVHDYFHNYLIGTEIAEDETYTYGSRLMTKLWDVIGILEKTPITNQATIEIAKPEDSCTVDPPCLRLVSFKVIPDFDSGGRFLHLGSRLDMHVYLRSWDLYAGMPENLGGLSLLQQMVSDYIGIPVGRMFAYSDGLHLYKYQKELAKSRTKIEKVIDW